MKGFVEDLKNRTGECCCLQYFMLSTHHSVGKVWTCGADDPTAVDDGVFASGFKLCDNAFVHLNLCFSCDIAKDIKARNPKATGFKIKCTDGQNTHIPILLTPGLYIPEIPGLIDRGDDEIIEAH